ncbi:hypothetical protein OG579_04455 [Williamsia herbipolensis]|uniref:Peptidase n=1 Tax=Williamsia herbipolensis TaxID=1603258 RepID=A0AAU4K4W6_9NOCA|nr:hypothetical protein [Williamsia herbipolensis]
MTRRWGAVPIAVALLVLAACGDGGGDTTTPTSQTKNVFEQQRTDGVQATLAKLSAAQKAGDANAIGALVDVTAAPAFRQTLVAEGTAIHDVGLSTLEYRIDPASSGGLGEQLLPAAVQSRLDDAGSSDSWVVPTVLRYALAGVDEPPVTVTDPLVFARYGDDWKIVGQAGPLLGTSAAPPPEFFDFPGVAARRVATGGKQSVVLDYPGSRALGARLQSAMPGAVAAVAAFWGPDWPRRTVVVATDSTTVFSALSRSAPADASAAAAATVSASDDAVGGYTVGQRVVFTPGAITGLPGPALDVVLRHELTHVAARTSTKPTAATWVTEGVAEYVGRAGTYRSISDAAPDLMAEVAAGSVPTGLPADDAFAVSGAGAPIAYQTAWSFAAYVAQTHGAADLKKLYLSLAGGPSTPAQQAQAMTAALGGPGAAVISGWQQWLRDAARR